MGGTGKGEMLPRNQRSDLEKLKDVQFKQLAIVIK